MSNEALGRLIGFTKCAEEEDEKKKKRGLLGPLLAGAGAAGVAGLGYLGYQGLKRHNANAMATSTLATLPGVHPLMRYALAMRAAGVAPSRSEVPAATAPVKEPAEKPAPIKEPAAKPAASGQPVGRVEGKFGVGTAQDKPKV